MKNNTLKDKKTGSTVKFKEHSKQMIEEETHGEDLKKPVVNKGKKTTYVEALLKGTKGNEKRAIFKV